METALIIGLAIGLTCIVTGMVVAKSYYRTKHGVPMKVINGGIQIFFTPAYYLAWVWPLVFILPTLKEPQQCQHPDHIRTRQLIASGYLTPLDATGRIAK